MLSGARTPFPLPLLQWPRDFSVIHRDLKPSNILMQGAQPLIADFGIAKDTARELDTTTASGVIKGTTSYLSPEVLQGSKHTSASDIWALGVVMYEIAAAVEQKSDESGNSEPGPMPVLMPGQVWHRFVAVTPE